MKRFTVRRDVLSQCGRTPATDAGLDGWRKIISKTSDELRELRDAELALVSGGGGKTNVLGTAAVMWGAAVDAVLEGVVIPLVTTL